ncbi:hypothetical protein Vretimale_2334 [Volvox reticuliferus]|nr:hypothetical protein Vretimale_2334 [Volvox reticuliferus]
MDAGGAGGMTCQGIPASRVPGIGMEMNGDGDVATVVQVEMKKKVSTLAVPPCFPSLPDQVNSLIAAGQVWRLVTPLFLHSNPFHLLINMHALHTLGPQVEVVSGSKRTTVIYLASGVLATLASFMLCTSPSLGASGAVFGLGAALGVFYWWVDWCMGTRKGGGTGRLSNGSGRRSPQALSTNRTRALAEGGSFSSEWKGWGPRAPQSFMLRSNSWGIGLHVAPAALYGFSRSGAGKTRQSTKWTYVAPGRGARVAFRTRLLSSPPPRLLSSPPPRFLSSPHISTSTTWSFLSWCFLPTPPG